MPLELGLFMGAMRFGNSSQKGKRCLVLDCEDFRYQKFISDIAGQDVFPHNNDQQNAVGLVRDWLRNASGKTGISGRSEMFRRYKLFRNYLPKLCKQFSLNEDELIFYEYTTSVSDWLEEFLRRETFSRSSGRAKCSD